MSLFFHRYVDKNVKSSSLHRKYNDHVPLYLHNRPRYFVTNCVKKLEAAESIDSNLINEIGDGKYLVKSCTNSGGYSVDLGKKSGKLSCECFDWRKHKLPCKHIMGIMLFKKDSFDSIAMSYREAPCYNLDKFVVPQINSNSTQIGINDPPVFDSSIDDNATQTSELHAPQPSTKLPIRKYPKKTKGSACRELLQELKSLTFLTYDVEALEKLEECLLDLRDLVVRSCPSDEGLVIEEKTHQRRFKHKEETTNQNFLQLPVPRKKAITGRVGLKAEIIKSSSVTKLDQCSSNHQYQRAATVEEHIVLDDDAVYDIPMVNTPEEEVVIVAEVAASVGPAKKLRKLVFSEQEKESILSQQMLTDESINLAQNLLSQQFPDVDGLMDTVLGKINGFDIVKTSRRFSQILHTGAMHWICIGIQNITRSSNKCVEVYDSLSSGHITPSTAAQLANICHTHTKNQYALIFDLFSNRKMVWIVGCLQ